MKDNKPAAPARTLAAVGAAGPVGRVTGPSPESREKNLKKRYVYVPAGENHYWYRSFTERTMRRSEPEYTNIAKGISAEIWSAEIQSQQLNTALRLLLYLAGILAVVLGVLVFFIQ
ncbi:MAG: hypothetical protein LUQ64_02675 [Methanomicrobiales archaeon]|nr:hypothetical protein [Methanomicrobiales archaeon]